MLNLDNVLVIHHALECPELEFLRKSFCGRVLEDGKVVVSTAGLFAVYACGDIEKIAPLAPNNKARSYLFLSFFFFSLNHSLSILILFQKPFSQIKLFVVRELSFNFGGDANLVSLGQVPINYHGVGVFFPRFFDEERTFFERITKEHDFQSLSLSDKPGNAFRRGIYLTKVKQRDDESILFRLLRCSTNLAGPTDNLRETGDIKIVFDYFIHSFVFCCSDVALLQRVNHVRPLFFPDSAELNHVLAQTYHNSESENGKQKKAKISEHSDKTKDMPEGGLLAFCTFYEDFENDFKKLGSEKSGFFDYVFGKGTTSVLTKLRFRLKPQALEINPTLAKSFDVTLFPNSVYIMSLLANRWYTHEIVPSSLNVEKVG